MYTYVTYKETKKYIDHTLLILSFTKYLLKCVTKVV